MESYNGCFIKYDGLDMSNVRKICGDSFVRSISEIHASTDNTNKIHFLGRSYIKMADGQLFEVYIGDYIGKTNDGDLFICRPETFEMLKKLSYLI